jgi:hypothetical protein
MYENNEIMKNINIYFIVFHLVTMHRKLKLTFRVRVTGRVKVFQLAISKLFLRINHYENIIINKYK